MAEENLPDNLKNGLEALSGISIDGVKAHLNADKPTQVDPLFSKLIIAI